ncbi:MAG TPA: HAD-IA family hydrolase [Vicinamibacterales bacterium]|nr:HAD-IA family hydrolase [Vicinamibacterales bacterium]
MSVRLIVFDLDGTLVDSLRDLAESANTLIVECGGAGAALEDEAVAKMVGDGAATLVSRAFAAAGIPQPPDALSRFLSIYDDRLLRHTRPYPGVPEALAALSKRTKVCVLTNKPLAATRRILDGLGLARFIDPRGVFGGDGPYPRKPDPAGLQALMTMAGVSPAATVLVGDSGVDLKTARAARVGICLVRYGFGFENIADDCGPDALVVDRPSQFAELLL